MLKDLGISSKLLFSQIEGSSPYALSIESSAPFILEIQNYKTRPHDYYESNLFNYFFISMCAHWSTCGSFCPTDVDNNIRYNLWRRKDTPNSLEAMWNLTLESLHWDYKGVSNKIIYHPDEPSWRLSYHEGTWFSVAVGAYAATLHYKNAEYRKKLYDLMAWEMEKEQKIAEYWLKNDLLTFIKLTALISHNLGDFDRVVEMWKIPENDPLVKNLYKLSLKPNTLFNLMCEYYKKYLSIDNHRNFAYRAPKCLRKSETLLLPIGPFHEAWGENIAKTNVLNEDEKTEIIIAMASGFVKLPGDTYSYARAYHGFKKNYPRLNQIMLCLSKKDLKPFENINFQRKSDTKTSEFQQGYILNMQKMLKDYNLT